MQRSERANQANALMMRFVERTGETRRYLWTDAFAVCNLLGLGHQDLALRLIGRVHRVLGHHRPDDRRVGWLSGLAPELGERHPTLGGLRIGKPRPERGPDQPLDEDLEWERDGQYFHYLTRWMHALDRAALVTRRAAFSTWACELAEVAQRSFTHGRRMSWKMSIDLSRPLVPSMGQHDPLDGYLTCRRLAATARALDARAPDLTRAITELHALIDPSALATADPLGIGGLLVDAHRIARLQPAEPALLDAILVAALTGLHAHVEHVDPRLPPDRRLAFRELGLAIGLGAVPRIETEHRSTQALLDRLAGFGELRDEIETRWRAPEQHRSRAWTEQEDINEVMLATCLEPNGFLG